MNEQHNQNIEKFKVKNLQINYLAVLIAPVIAILFSSLYYSPLMFGNIWKELRDMDPIATSATKPLVFTIIGELARTLVITYVIARLVAQLGIADWKSAMRLGSGCGLDSL